MTAFWEQNGTGTTWLPVDTDGPGSIRYAQPRLLYENNVLQGLCTEGGELLATSSDIRAQGAKSDGSADCTAIIQAAIDKAGLAGGGVNGYYDISVSSYIHAGGDLMLCIKNESGSTVTPGTLTVRWTVIKQF